MIHGGGYLSNSYVNLSELEVGRNRIIACQSKSKDIHILYKYLRNLTSHLLLHY